MGCNCQLIVPTVSNDIARSWLGSTVIGSCSLGYFGSIAKVVTVDIINPTNIGSILLCGLLSIGNLFLLPMLIITLLLPMRIIRIIKKYFSITQLKIKAVATVDCGSIMCCDIGAIRHRHGWFTSDVHGLSDELLLKVTNHSPERTLR